MRMSVCVCLYKFVQMYPQTQTGQLTEDSFVSAPSFPPPLLLLSFLCVSIFVPSGKQAKQFLWKMLRKFHIMGLPAPRTDWDKGTARAVKGETRREEKKNAELTMCDFSVWVGFRRPRLATIGR